MQSYQSDVYLHVLDSHSLVAPCIERSLLVTVRMYIEKGGGGPPVVFPAIRQTNLSFGFNCKV